MDTRFLGSLFAVVFASFVQLTPVASVSGAKIGIALAVVFFVAFFVRSFVQYAILAALSSALIAFPSGFFFGAAAVFPVFLAGYLVRRAAAWQPWLSYPSSLFIATFVLYALADFSFLVSRTGLVFREGAHTAVFGLFLYLVISLPHDLPRRHTF